MNISELFLLALSLSMDAFAIAICKGLSMKKSSVKNMSIVGTWFGGFQAIMPLLGYFLGTALSKYILPFDNIVSFVLLTFIGFNMVKSSFSKETQNVDKSLKFKTMFAMAIATSVDSLAVGVTFSLIPNVNIWFCIALIGVVTFLISAFGVKIGNIFGIKYKSKAEFIGGATLIIIGLKLLLT